MAKSARSGVGMRRLGAVRACAVTEVPVIRDCVHPASHSLRREIDHLTRSCCRGHVGRDGRRGLGNATIDYFDHFH